MTTRNKKGQPTDQGGSPVVMVDAPLPPRRLSRRTRWLSVPAIALALTMSVVTAAVADHCDPSTYGDGEGHSETVSVGGGNPTGTPTVIVGTTYSEVRPLQDCLTRSTVDYYYNLLRSGQQVAPITIEIYNNGMMWIRDGTHRYVASMLAGVAIQAYFWQMGENPSGEDPPDWSNTRYC